MKHFVAILALTLSVASAAQAGEIKQSFNDGSVVTCHASMFVDKKGNTDSDGKFMDIMYRVDYAGQDAVAYFKTTPGELYPYVLSLKKFPELGQYSFEGACYRTSCDLGIRESATNVYFQSNIAYDKKNDNGAIISISKFKDNLKLSFECHLIEAKPVEKD